MNVNSAMKSLEKLKNIIQDTSILPTIERNKCFDYLYEVEFYLKEHGASNTQSKDYETEKKDPMKENIKRVVTWEVIILTSVGLGLIFGGLYG